MMSEMTYTSVFLSVLGLGLVSKHSTEKTPKEHALVIFDLIFATVEGLRFLIFDLIFDLIFAAVQG